MKQTVPKRTVYTVHNSLICFSLRSKTLRGGCKRQTILGGDEDSQHK